MSLNNKQSRFVK